MERYRKCGINWPQRSEYELSETGVRVQEKDFSGISESSVAYDCIGKEATYFLRQSTIAKFGTIVFVIFAAVTGALYVLHGNVDHLASIFWAGAAMLSFVYYRIKRREGFLLQSRFGYLAIHGNKKEAEPFIKAIQDRKLEFIKENVRHRISTMGFLEAEGYLISLKEGSVLTQEQYDSIRLKAGLESNTARSSGFESIN
jgi:hypothetical protein